MIFDLKTTLLAGGAALAIGLFVGGAGAWAARGWQADKDLAELRSTYDRSYAASSEQARAKESELQSIAEQLRAKVPDEDAKTKADAAAADGSVDSLRRAAGVYAASASCDTSAQQRGQAAAKAAGLLSDLLAECSATKSEMGKAFDESYKRALRCEAQYDGIRSATMNQPSK